MKRFARIIATIILCVVFVGTLFACNNDVPVTETSLGVDFTNVKSEVSYGTELDLTGLVVEVKLSNGRYILLARDDEKGYKVNSGNYNPNVPGTYNISVSYKEFAPAMFRVKVLEPRADDDLVDLVFAVSITVNAINADRIFHVGDEFSSTGLAVGVNMSDDSVVVLEKGQYTLNSEAFDTTKEGQYTIKVNVDYEGKEFSDSYNVVVLPR